MNKILVDTDPGCDDAVALMFLVRSGVFDIKAVTTVAGNTTIESVTRNAQAILDLLGESKLTLSSGSATPLNNPLVTATIHGKSGLDGIDTRNTKMRLTGDADEQIVRQIKDNPGELTLITLGPLTNVARAFQKEPMLPKALKEVVIMGGAIHVCGNMNRVAEFNMFVDPDAADIVLRSDARKVLIPLDVCNKVLIPMRMFGKLKTSPLYAPIIAMMKGYSVELEKDAGVRGVLLYDTVAAYYLYNPQAFSLASMDIVLETKGIYTRGMTVAEKRLTAKKNENVRVALDIDTQAFMKDFIRILGPSS